MRREAPAATLGEENIYKADTTPPPAGGDAYSAPTEVRELPEEVLAGLRARKLPGGLGSLSFGATPTSEEEFNESSAVRKVSVKAAAVPVVEPPKPVEPEALDPDALEAIDPDGEPEAQHAYPESGAIQWFHSKPKGEAQASAPAAPAPGPEAAIAILAASTAAAKAEPEAPTASGAPLGRWRTRNIVLIGAALAFAYVLFTVWFFHHK